jgi:SAM-dependent methyltransferase
MQTLKRVQQRGRYVVADGTRLPFGADSLDQIICSEVLEHVEDDQAAITELARVLRPGGLALITVPHNKAYFAADDRYVRHFRRYEVVEMHDKLRRAGLELVAVHKVLGPLEKATMLTIVVLLSAFERASRREERPPAERSSRLGALLRGTLRPMFKYAHRGYALLARIDAAVMPQSLAAVLLFEGVKPKSANA